MQAAHGEWSEWLLASRQPVLFAFGSDWEPPTPEALHAFRAELRELGALVVVAARNTSFCLGPDAAPRSLPALDQGGFEQLYRAIHIDPGDRHSNELTLTLVDEHGRARMQSTWPAGEELAPVVLSVVAWAERSLVETLTRPGTLEAHAPFGFTRREAALLSLIGGLALPFAAGCPLHDRPAHARRSARRVPALEIRHSRAAAQLVHAVRDSRTA